MSNTIFVPIDFSAYTAQQLMIAKNWASWLQAELWVVHQMEDPIPTLADKSMRLQLHYENKRAISQEWFKLQDAIFDGNDKVRFEPTSQNLIQFLEENAQNTSENIIIMGLKGKGKLEQIFLGSKVTEVVEKLNHTVIAVPKTELEITPQKLFVIAHPKYPFKLTLLKRFVEKIERLVEEIHFITFVEENDNVLDLENYLNEFKSEINFGIPTVTKILPGKN